MFWRHWPKHGILLFFDVNECLANGQRLENPARMTKYFVLIASLIKRKISFSQSISIKYSLKKGHVYI